METHYQSIDADKRQGSNSQRRKAGRPVALVPGKLTAARRMLSEGMTRDQVAFCLGVGRSTIYRAFPAEEAFSGPTITPQEIALIETRTFDEKSPRHDPEGNTSGANKQEQADERLGVWIAIVCVIVAVVIAVFYQGVAA